jgi:WD40 repeat protein
MIKVLLFAASPRGTAPLDLPREFREIDEEIRLGPFRDAVELVLVPGARPVDLLRKLNECRPQIVHFSSHGGPEEILMEGGHDDPSDLQDTSTRSAQGRDMKAVGCDEGECSVAGRAPPHPVSRSALVEVLRACDEGDLRLVILNACYTRPQAEALAEVVDCIVSMSREITDRAAIKFAASFYGALSYGRSVQRAFDQGVARLHAEGIDEAGTPELLVRAGVDASRVVLVGTGPGQVDQPADAAPFLVPFPRNADFVGRDEDLARLHASLSGPGPVGIRPAGLTGMGGIGKTQLAVEYIHRHRGDYSDGVFWIDAAGPLAEGFARLATDTRLRWAASDLPRDEQVRAAFAELSRRPRALLVLDNLPDPATLAVPLVPGCTPEDLGFRLLFTTRRHDLGRFAAVEITILPEDPALRLLLRHPARRAALDPSHPDHEHARAIARMLGRLPLALELAGAYLGKFSGDVSLQGYREGLRVDGSLSTLDADAVDLTEADLRRVHDPAVAATIGEQWVALGDDSARLLLRVASLFTESTAVSIVRLGLLTGLSDEARPGRLSPLLRAVKRLDDSCLVERLEADQIRLHPLIREFASGQMSPDQLEDFRRRCLERAAEAVENFPTLEALETRRGVDGLQEDLIAILEVCPPSASDLSTRIQTVLRLLQREANHLRLSKTSSQPSLFAQQIRNRALLMGIDSLQSSAEQKLSALGQPHFRLLWRASRESPALIRTFTGHPASTVAVTPDGRYAISGSSSGYLAIWDLQTGQLFHSFGGHQKGVTALAVTLDGQQAISTSYDNTIRLWHIQTGQLLRTCSGHMDGVTALATTPDGRGALSASYDGTLKLWDVRTGQLIRSYHGHEGRLTAVAVTPDGRYAFSASEDYILALWDLQTAQILRTFFGHKDRVTGLSVTPGGLYVLSSSLDGSLKLWDVQTGQLIRTLAGHKPKHGVTAVATTPDGRGALSASWDGTLKVWDLQIGRILHSFEVHEGVLTAVVVTKDGHHAVSCSDDGSMRLWDLQARQSLGSSEGHEGSINAIAMIPDGRQVVSASYDGTVKLWDLRTGQLCRTFVGEGQWSQSVVAVAATPDGRQLILGCGDCTVQVWDIQTGQLSRTFTGHKSWVTAVAVTYDGRRASSGSADKTLNLWDIETGHLLSTFTGHAKTVRTVAVAPDARRAISGSHDGTLRLWDLETGEHCLTLVGHRSRVNAVAVSSDGRYAISGSSDCTLKLWDLQTGRLHFTLAGHKSWVSAVGISRDGRHAVSCSDDRTLRLWDLQEQRCKAMVLLESSPWTIAMAPDGQRVAIGDRGGNVYGFTLHIS